MDTYRVNHQIVEIMCGRYTVITKLNIIEKEFQADTSGLEFDFQGNVNVAPGDRGLVIASDDPSRVQLFTFGFSPFWAKKRMYVINARSEGNHNPENDPLYTGAKGILTKPMFRKAIRSQRCLVIADAFVEGTEKEKLKRPYLVYRLQKKRPFAMAGIWDEWADPETGEVHRGFAILTTAANDLMQKIPHHRAPLVLTPDQEKAWIDTDTPLADITAFMHPFDAYDFNAYPISPAIRSPQMKSPEVLKPTGQPLKKEYEYEFYKTLQLQGMGQTTARRRKEGEQLDLFEDME